MTITLTPAEPAEGGSGGEATSKPHSPNPDPMFTAIARDFRPTLSVDKPMRRSAPRRRRALAANVPAEHHALYRLYDAEDVLLYIGETNNPVERYVEHSLTKDWWPEVASHSVEWWTDGREKVEERERRAIRDEFPLHNIAHQPRGDGTYFVPSYVVEKILGAVRQAVREVISDAVEQDVDLIADIAEEAFKPDSNGAWGEIGFPFSEAPQAEDLGLSTVLDAMGPFRPDIDNSMRDPKPQKRSARHCKDAAGHGRSKRTCGGKLRRDGRCPNALNHNLEDARGDEVLLEVFHAAYPPSLGADEASASVMPASATEAPAAIERECLTDPLDAVDAPENR